MDKKKKKKTGDSATVIFLIIRVKRDHHLNFQAFTAGHTDRFQHYRNAVDRQRKVLRATYYASKANHLKQAKLSQW